MPAKEFWMFRHGETLWTITGQHTGTTDLDLTNNGKEQAKRIRRAIEGKEFDHVFVSPLKRVQETCQLAGLSHLAKEDADLMEWDYGLYEGKTSLEIQKTNPDWTIFKQDPPEGETAKEVEKRADRFWKRVLQLDGRRVAIFSSGHFSRVLGARFVGAPVSFGQHLSLSTASISQFGFEHNEPVIKSWNDVSHYRDLIDLPA